MHSKYQVRTAPTQIKISHEQKVVESTSGSWRPISGMFKSYGELYIQNSQRIIRHNRRILKTLCPQGKATVRKEVLDQMGYDYRYFSGLFKTKTNLYYLVYDYAFSPIFENGIEKALIVQRQEYMDRLTLDIWKK